MMTRLFDCYCTTLIHNNLTINRSSDKKAIKKSVANLIRSSHFLVQFTPIQSED